MTHEWKMKIYNQASGVLEAEGFEADVLSNYSGRGMFGSEVPAIVTDAPATMVGWAVTCALVDIRCERAGQKATALDLLDGSAHVIPRRQDNMGVSYVYY